jgi:ABC-type Fe3+-hydroxamate transport system substrate-binding protein
MTVLAALPLPDGIFVAAPSIYTFTAYLQTLGFDVIVPADDSATVSWELVPTELTADAVLLAVGADYPTNDELLGSQPTWRSHPGVAAGQVASVFPNVIVPSYASVTAVLRSCADALEGFRPLG